MRPTEAAFYRQRLWSRERPQAALPDRIEVEAMSGIAFRRGGRSPHVAPVASGRFAFLEMSDRRVMHSRSTPARPAADEHREPSLRLLEAWVPVEQELRAAVDTPTFNIWLADVHPHSLIAGQWRLGCDERHVGWLQARFGKVVAGCAARPVVFVACRDAA